MRAITSFCLLALVVSMVFSGIPISVEAQADPNILLKIASQAQKQIETQISNQQVSDEVQKLFEEGSAEVDSLKDSLENDDISSARNHFLSAMKIFKKISQMILERPTVGTAISVSNTAYSLSSDLERMVKFLSKLKTIAEKHDSGIDFSEIDRLISITKSNIYDGNFDETKKNIVQIKRLLSDIKTTLVAQANESKTARAKDFAQKHLEKLANLIEKVKNLEGIDPSQIQEAERILSEAKNLLSDGNTDEAFNLLRTLSELVKKLRS
ncbi:MAG: exported protein of unknown function [Nitrosopumilales archaeon]|nr:MAG: exported protein of unknown function [Nitrosopumilales archaeon]